MTCAPTRVRRTVPLGAGVLTALLLAGCGKDPEPTAPVASGTPQTSATAAPSATVGPTVPPGVDQVVRVAYRGGSVTGPKGRVKVAQGSTVQLVVSSDKADEVHLHGYDKHVDVPAGGTVRLTFTATIPGVFTVELEKLKVTLVRLQVQ